jgi:hypothetical protein
LGGNVLRLPLSQLGNLSLRGGVPCEQLCMLPLQEVKSLPEVFIGLMLLLWLWG